MKMKTFALRKMLAAALTLFGLSSCTLTGSLWDESWTRQDYASQNEWVHAFGFTKSSSQNLPPNRLIMLGEKAVYVTDITPEHDLVKALRTTELSKPFGFQSIDGFHNGKGVLQIDLKQDGRFIAATKLDKERGQPTLCLDYTAESHSDVSKLKALGFYEEWQKGYYVRCYGTIRGTRYAMSESLPAEYRFKTPVKIVVKSDKGEVLDAGQVAKTVFLTPFAIIGDVLLFPVMLPLLPYKGARI